MKNHEEFMREVIRLAAENASCGNGGPFAAVVVKDGTIIGRGTNRVTASNDPTAHAEIVAIREACAALGSFQLEGCILYTSCEPCPMCLGAIYWARPERVLFGSSRDDAAAAGFDDRLIYDEIDRAPLQRKIPMDQLLRDEAQEPFAKWLSFAGRILY